MFKGFANPGDIGEHELWVKYTTSAECKTNISAVLTVMSGLDPHMIIKLEDDLNRWVTYDVTIVTLLLLGLMV